jgi:glutamate--cysteine ligase
LAELSLVESRLRESADARGIELLAVGVDPFNSPEAAPLQLTADRYSRMARYFAGIGADGARMMRQTASLQINIGGVPAADRWQSANALAPWLIALFANSSRYAGTDTGYPSYRAETWRGVDPGRTGVFAGDNAVGEYAEFALSANAFLADDSAPPFGALDSHLATDAAFRLHLSTLFPEVRPRGYLELRSLDAGNADHRRAALVLVAGALADSRANHEVRTLLGGADEVLLREAGRNGARDPRIGSRAPDLIRIALDGCARLGDSVISRDLVDRAADSLSRLVAASRATAPTVVR